MQFSRSALDQTIPFIHHLNRSELNRSRAEQSKKRTNERASTHPPDSAMLSIFNA